MRKKITICGSGTAGLITALTLRHIFKYHEITVVSSSRIGIIGVGEGSTEHWREFCDSLHMDKGEMVRATKATHKYGIYYENWTKHTPFYFHSIALESRGVHGYSGNYSYALENNMLLTNISSQPLINDTVISCPSIEAHNLTNQFHFDTFKLNEYLKNLGARRGIKFIEGEVVGVVQNTENGWVESLQIDGDRTVDGDFFVDATGFHRAIMSRILPDDEFINYRKYLPCDSSAVFPTPSQEDGNIRPYTRARAMPSGWMFEIPTQERRGNGYIFSSDFCSDEQAIKEIQEIHGDHIEPRIIKWKSGHYKTQLFKNVVCTGLASSFIEPLEATSISTSIIQAKMICSVIPTITPESKAMITQYHKRFEALMNNALCMIALHYISDRDDSEMWIAQKSAQIPDSLQELLDLWKERTPHSFDIPVFNNGNYELFASSHFWHVAQGQGVLNRDVATMEIEAYDSRKEMEKMFSEMATRRIMTKLVPHASIFKEE
jgi:tryptophan halogenase